MATFEMASCVDTMLYEYIVDDSQTVEGRLNAFDAELAEFAKKLSHYPAIAKFLFPLLSPPCIILYSLCTRPIFFRRSRPGIVVRIE